LLEVINAGVSLILRNDFGEVKWEKQPSAVSRQSPGGKRVAGPPHLTGRWRLATGGSSPPHL